MSCMTMLRNCSCVVSMLLIFFSNRSWYLYSSVVLMSGAKYSCAVSGVWSMIVLLLSSLVNFMSPSQDSTFFW